MQIDRRSLLLSTLALAVPVSAQAQESGSIERPYWPTARWKRDEPEDQQVDPGLLAQADAVVEADMPDVTGFVVVRGGYVIHERYWGERYGRNDPIKIRSITKSVTGALIGIALEEGHLESLDQTLGELIPDKIPDDADPLTETITVRNLLTMTSGWDWDIGSDYERLISSENWLEYTLSQPVAYQPGSYFAYNSGGSHVLSVILTEVTGQDTADYAQEKLFSPLGIKRPTWQRSPQDEAVGGFGLELTPRNMAKFGYLHLKNGVWDGEQIIPDEYVAAATSYQSSGDSTGYAAYGYQWWVTEPFGMAAYFALGFGSQYIYVVPERDLVVVFVKGFDDRPTFISISRPLIETYVVPAAAPREPVG
jgi:CubicO group peptidase (beta-lactamase class C family)